MIGIGIEKLFPHYYLYKTFCNLAEKNFQQFQPWPLVENDKHLFWGCFVLKGAIGLKVEEKENFSQRKIKKKITNISSTLTQPK